MNRTQAPVAAASGLHTLLLEALLSCASAHAGAPMFACKFCIIHYCMITGAFLQVLCSPHKRSIGPVSQCLRSGSISEDLVLFCTSMPQLERCPGWQPAAQAVGLCEVVFATFQFRGFKVFTIQ